MAGPRTALADPARSVRSLALVCLAATLFAVSGCGGDSTGPTSAGPSEAGPPAVSDPPTDGGEPAAGTPASAVPAAVDPCSLVSRQEAEQLAGTALNEPRKVKATCTYTAPPSGPTAQVEVFVGAGAKKILDVNRNLGHELRELPGVGDEAYAEDRVVYVHKGGQWVSVRLVRLNDPAENRQGLEAVARQVADRL
ncbi:DUF3558 family protein [Micromonospora sp. WMMD1082]|uniref:DUF3558 family protein n=1 Tax=Micromonospora sp. WMMD1082 TaxID=3016104 RepID=UPI0024162314|nr:DUF3558 family protein [Micromonospora sp. WMMD1082]MDG4793428.1 DUF3558 family protein [Micromonospora sp. WMMD1082]